MTISFYCWNKNHRKHCAELDFFSMNVHFFYSCGLVGIFKYLLPLLMFVFTLCFLSAIHVFVGSVIPCLLTSFSVPVTGGLKV